MRAFVVFLAFASGCSNQSEREVPAVQVPAEAVPHPTRSEDVMIIVANGTATINGVVFDKKPTLTEIQQIFGPPDRVADLMNRIHTWDQLGLGAYERDGVVGSISLWFRPDIFEFVAKQTFAGKLFVEGRMIAAGTEFKRLGKPFKRFGEFGTSVDYMRGPVGVFISADEETEKVVHSASVSFYDK